MRTSYDTDFYTWSQEQAQALRAKEWPALDIEHLAEEIASLGTTVIHAMKSQLRRLLLHLLKYHYDPAQDPRRGWAESIADARDELADHLEENRGLRHLPGEYLPRAYRLAVTRALRQTDLPPRTFPEACPWTVEQVLDPDFWPEPPARP